MAENAPSTFARRFWPPLIVGLIGVATLPLTIVPVLKPRSALLAQAGLSLTSAVALSMAQVAVLLIAAVAMGASFAHRLGLHSHLAATASQSRFSDELPLAVSAGVIVGVIIVALDWWFFLPRLPNLAAAGAAAGGAASSLISGALYGGLTEELLMRWGLMSIVAWLVFRFFWRRVETPPPSVFGIAIVLTALLFGVGHLPATAATVPLTGLIVARSILLNGLAGLVFGLLFWRRTLESAMVAHGAVHVVFALTLLANGP
jgi:hypothetical protein